MPTELFYLVLVTVFTALLWVPYILDRIAVWGLRDAVGYPATPKLQSPWAERLRRAHANAVENLVVFATLVLAAAVAGIESPLIASAAIVYFWARVVHALAYPFAVPWIRTLAFVAGLAAQLTIAWQLLA